MTMSNSTINNCLVCYVDWHSFTDEHYFETEQEACEFFFQYAVLYYV